MKVACDPVSVGDEHQLLAVGDRLCPVEGERCLVGERREHLCLVGGKRPAPGGQHDEQDSGVDEVGA